MSVWGKEGIAITDGSRRWDSGRGLKSAKALGLTIPPSLLLRAEGILQ